MLASLFLISLVGSAVAAPRPAVDVRAVDTSGWIVRADWSSKYFHILYTLQKVSIIYLLLTYQTTIRMRKCYFN